MIQPETLQKFQAKYSQTEVSEFRGQTRAVVPREQAYEALQMLRDTLGFDLLVDVTCVDYLHFRNAVVIQWQNSGVHSPELIQAVDHQVIFFILLKIPYQNLAGEGFCTQRNTLALLLG